MSTLGIDSKLYVNDGTYNEPIWRQVGTGGYLRLKVSDQPVHKFDARLRWVRNGVARVDVCAISRRRPKTEDIPSMPAMADKILTACPPAIGQGAGPPLVPAGIQVDLPPVNRPSMPYSVRVQYVASHMTGSYWNWMINPELFALIQWHQRHGFDVGHVIADWLSDHGMDWLGCGCAAFPTHAHAIAASMSYSLVHSLKYIPPAFRPLYRFPFADPADPETRGWFRTEDLAALQAAWID